MCNFHVSITKLICVFDFHYLPTRFELNFAVNVMGTYAMTELMVPLLEKAESKARVITVSSGGMYTAPLTGDLQVSCFCYYFKYVLNLEANLQNLSSKMVTRLTFLKREEKKRKEKYSST